jgi:hypothetical protein
MNTGSVSMRLLSTLTVAATALLVGSCGGGEITQKGKSWAFTCVGVCQSTMQGFRGEVQVVDDVEYTADAPAPAATPENDL